MTITLNVNTALGFHVIKFGGVVTFAELVKLGRLHHTRPDLAAVDAIHIVDEFTDLSGLTSTQMDVLRQHYRQLHQSIEFYVVRRSAWVCRSTEACRLLEYWLADRHSRDGQGTEVCLVTNLAEAGDMFSAEEIAAVHQWHGFIELVRIDDTEEGTNSLHLAAAEPSQQG